jgi:hypothetical protein
LLKFLRKAFVEESQSLENFVIPGWRIGMVDLAQAIKGSFDVLIGSSIGVKSKNPPWQVVLEDVDPVDAAIPLFPLFVGKDPDVLTINALQIVYVG